MKHFLLTLSFFALILMPLVSHAQDESNDLCKPIERYTAQGDWHYQSDGLNGKITLCNSVTGEISLALPDNVGWAVDFPPSVSLNGGWLGIWGGDVIDDSIYQFYSYETISGKFNYLGKIASSPGLEFPQFKYWVSDSLGLVGYGQQGGGLAWAYFAFDASQPNSLVSAFTGWPDYFDNPLHYEYLSSQLVLEHHTGSEIPADEPSTLTVYDASGLHHYTLFYNAMSALRTAGGYYYLTTQQAGAESISILVYLDGNTGESTEIMNGEIEALDSVSPDGRYVALTMDNTGIVDLAQHEILPDLFDWRNIQAYVVIVDTKSSSFDKVVYQTETLDRRKFNSNLRFVEWVDPKTALLTLGIAASFETFSVRHITFDERGYTEKTVDAMTCLEWLSLHDAFALVPLQTYFAPC